MNNWELRLKIKENKGNSLAIGLTVTNKEIERLE